MANWWDSINQALDSGKEAIQTSLNNLSTAYAGVGAALGGQVPPTQQISTTPTAAQPVAGTNTSATSSLNIDNKMLLVMGAALLATLYFLKKR